MIARTLENWIKIFEYGDMTEAHFFKHLDQFDYRGAIRVNYDQHTGLPKVTFTPRQARVLP